MMQLSEIIESVQSLHPDFSYEEIAELCYDYLAQFNEKTKEFMGKDVIVHIQVFEDRTFDWTCLGQPVDDLIREATKIKKGSGKPNSEKVGKISRADLEKIAEQKKDQLNAIDTDGAVKIIAGTARSMGVEVTD